MLCKISSDSQLDYDKTATFLFKYPFIQFLAICKKISYKNRHNRDFFRRLNLKRTLNKGNFV